MNEWLMVLFWVFFFPVVSPWADYSGEVEVLVVLRGDVLTSRFMAEVIGIFTPVSSSWEVVLTSVWSPEFRLPAAGVDGWFRRGCDNGLFVSMSVIFVKKIVVEAEVEVPIVGPGNGLVDTF